MLSLYPLSVSVTIASLWWPGWCSKYSHLLWTGQSGDGILVGWDFPCCPDQP